jgi:hypothetical protein
MLDSVPQPGITGRLSNVSTGLVVGHFTDPEGNLVAGPARPEPPCLRSG